MTDQDTQESRSLLTVMKTVQILSTFLCVRDRMQDVDVVALFPGPYGDRMVEYGQQVFFRTRAKFLFLIGGSHDRAERSRLYKRLLASRILEEQIVFSETPMRTKVEVTECLRRLRAILDEDPDKDPKVIPKDPGTIAVVAPPHQMLRHRAIVQSAISTTSTVLMLIPETVELMDFLSPTDTRPPDIRLADLLAEEVKELQRRLVLKDIRLPELFLEPVSGTLPGKIRSLKENILELAGVYSSPSSAPPDRVTLV